MKLCIVTHQVNKGDGQGRVNYEVAREAIRRGHQVTLLASQVDLELQNNSQVEWIAIPVQGLPTALLRERSFSWQSAQWLRRHASEFNLVKVNGAITDVPSDINAVHFVHSSWLRSPVHTARVRRDLYGLYHWFYTALNAHLEKQAFSKADAIVAVSEKVKKELVDLGVPSQQIRVILNGVDLQEFCPGNSDRDRLNLPEKVTLAFFAGDLRTSRKNLDVVLRALTEVPDLHLAVAGSTESSPYPLLAAQLGLRERVHFLGYQRDIASIMRSVDLFVFPSRYEACTLVLLEAMATGLPVITATTTGGSEIITPNCGAILSDPDDIEALVRALRTLASDRQLRKQMGKASRDIAEHYSWLTQAKSYIDLFEELSKSNENNGCHSYLSSLERPGALLRSATATNSPGR